MIDEKKNQTTLGKITILRLLLRLTIQDVAIKVLYKNSKR